MCCTSHLPLGFWGIGPGRTPPGDDIGAAQATVAGSTTDFLLETIPDTLVSSLTSGEILQALIVALRVGFAVQAMGRSGEPVLRGIGHFQRLVFRVLARIMWAAPIGVFGAIGCSVETTHLTRPPCLTTTTRRVRQATKGRLGRLNPR